MTTIPARGSVCFEARANLSRNYIERTVDPATGQPYFDVFDGAPPELYHDWPDFGDLTARYWETAIDDRKYDRSGPRKYRPASRTAHELFRRGWS